MILLIPLIILSTFIPDPPDALKLLQSYHTPADTTVMAEGRVYDDRNNEPMRNISIKMTSHNNQYVTVTDSTGYFKYCNIQPGTYRIEAIRKNSEKENVVLGKRWVYIPKFLLNGKDFIHPEIDWRITLEEEQPIATGQSPHALFSEPDTSAHIGFIHLYLYDAKSNKPLANKNPENIFDILNDFPVTFDVHGGGLYSIQTKRNTLSLTIRTDSHFYRSYTFKTSSDSIPNENTIVYLPLVAEKDENHFYYSGYMGGLVSSSNSNFLPDSIEVYVKELNYKTYTDENNRFFLDKAFLGTFTFQFSHPLIEDIECVREIRNEIRYELRFGLFTLLKDEGTIRNSRLFGQVLNMETGLPISNARVDLMENEYTVKTSIYTDTDGFYLFRSLEQNDYLIRYSKRGYETSKIIKVEVASKKAKVHNVRKDCHLNPVNYDNKSHNGIVAFRIMNPENNRPFKGYTIYHINDDKLKHSDSNGVIVFDSLRAGTQRFTNQHFNSTNNPLYAKYIFEIPDTYLTHEEPDTIWFDLKHSDRELISSKGTWVKGKILDERQDAVENATVYFLPSFESVESDESGFFQRYLPVGSLEIQVNAEGFHLYEDSITVEYDENYLNFSKTEIFLLNDQKISNTKSSIHGIVYDAISKKPLPLVNIFLIGTNISVLTDKDGTFNLNDLESGKYLLEVTDLGMQAYTRWIDTAVNSDTIKIYINPILLTNHNLRIKQNPIEHRPSLKNLVRYEGQIFYSPSDVPIVAVPVYLSSISDQKSKYYSVTSQDGKFLFEVPKGKYQVQISTPISEEVSKNIELKKDKNNAVFLLKEHYAQICYKDDPPYMKYRAPYSGFVPNEDYYVEIDSAKTDHYYSKMNKTSTAIVPCFYDAETKEFLDDVVLFSHKVNQSIHTSIIHSISSHKNTSIELPLHNHMTTTAFLTGYQTLSFRNRAYYDQEQLYIYLLPENINSDHYKDLPKSDFMWHHHKLSRFLPDIKYKPDYVFTDDKSGIPLLQGETIFIHGTPYIGTFQDDSWLEVDPFTLHQYYNSRFYITLFSNNRKPKTRSIHIRPRIIKKYRPLY